uniref:HMA domain-containing protein n=2 Tax=Kalanchoe fedtschenkoi TaxID=63787 RepID=A0A7N1A0F5_KALFE
MSIMVPELEKPRVTEIQVRMDCNGCVQKVKKALNGITGIYDVYINYPEQKITILGWADPEKIVKAIRKTRKTATICAHFEPEAAEQAAEGASPPAQDGGANPPPQEGGSAEPPKDQPQPLPENPQQAAMAALPVTDAPSYDAGQPPHQEMQSARVVYHQPPDHYRNVYTHQCGPDWNNYQTVQQSLPQPPTTLHEPPSYITYRPPPPQMSLTQPSPPRIRATHNYNTRRSLPQLYATQPPHISEPPTIQESHSYQLSRPLTQTYVIQPPPMPEAQPPPTPQIQEPQQCYSGYSSSPQTYYTSQAQQLHHTIQPLQQIQSTHKYNLYSPSPYVTEYDYIQPPAPAAYSPYHHSAGRHYEDYSGISNNNGNISSMFSDENPNACTVM